MPEIKTVTMYQGREGLTYATEEEARLSFARSGIEEIFRRAGFEWPDVIDARDAILNNRERVIDILTGKA